MWAAWKTSFRSDHLKHQRQILASGGGEPLGGAHGVLPVDTLAALDCLETTLDNLALVATNNTVAAVLTATNKKLVDAAATAASCQQVAGTPPGMGRPPGSGAPKKTFPGSYCWMHSYKFSKEHTSATCLYQA